MNHRSLAMGVFIALTLGATACSGGAEPSVPPEPATTETAPEAEPAAAEPAAAAETDVDSETVSPDGVITLAAGELAVRRHGGLAVGHPTLGRRPPGRDLR